MKALSDFMKILFKKCELYHEIQEGNIVKVQSSSCHKFIYSTYLIITQWERFYHHNSKIKTQLRNISSLWYSRFPEQFPAPTVCSDIVKERKTRDIHWLNFCVVFPPLFELIELKSCQTSITFDWKWMTASVSIYIFLMNRRRSSLRKDFNIFLSSWLAGR